MAERLHYEIPAIDQEAQARREAYQELDALVISLHEHGVLRFLRDTSGSLGSLTRIAARQIDNQAGYDGLANLYLLARLAGRLPAEDFRRVTDALGDGFDAMSRHTTADEPYPPGLTGAYRLLKDDALWDAIGPLLEGIKAFSQALDAREGGTCKEPERC